MHSDFLLVLVVAGALVFDFTNGFHDTASVVASSISTNALSPRSAVLIAAVLNFAGAFISLKVAATIATGIIEPAKVTESIAFAGLVGAVVWNLVTWSFGLPSSSSHALIGGVVGAMLAARGRRGCQGEGGRHQGGYPGPGRAGDGVPGRGRRDRRDLPAGGPPPARPGYPRVSLGPDRFRLAARAAHGTNDAQKTMGVITLALVAHGSISADHFQSPLWVVIVSATAIALGTYAGGWRIIRTVGTRIIRMDPAQGFACQGAGAAVVLVSSHFGYPLSSTHVISGGVVGAGAATRLSAVRWGVAGNIAIAWALTLPAAAAIGAGAYWLERGLGSGVVGPLLISFVAVFLLVRALANHRSRIAQAARA